MVLVGQKKALALAVKGQRQVLRWSKLKDRLAGQDVLPAIPS